MQMVCFSHNILVTIALLELSCHAICYCSLQCSQLGKTDDYPLQAHIELSSTATTSQ